MAFVTFNEHSNLPEFQIWHPSSPGSSVYNRIGKVQSLSGSFISTNGYYNVNISLNGNEQIEFQSGDVIGYYQPTNPLRRVYNIQTSGYTSYSNSANSPATTINISDVNNIENGWQPLIEVIIGKIC